MNAYAGDHLLPERVGIISQHASRSGSVDCSKQSKEIVVVGIEIKDALVLVALEDTQDNRLGVVVDNADALDLREIAQAAMSNPQFCQT